MNKNLKIPFICFLLFSLTSRALAEINLTELVNKVQTAIVTIQAYDKNAKPFGQRTGFFINVSTLMYKKGGLIFCVTYWMNSKY